jgi:uncharacterized oligopeptide transporter (OPT) family protein
MAMYAAFGAMGPGTDLPAPQAYAVSTMVGGLPNPFAFFLGLTLGTLLYLVGMPAMTLGIGIYLPMFISATVFVGGVIAFAIKKILLSGKDKESGKKTGIVIASGLLGGEGIAGVLIALWKVLYVQTKINRACKNSTLFSKIIFLRQESGLRVLQHF